MPEQLTVSPLLDGFTVGSPVGDRYGVSCYPAVRGDSQRKYIVKVISVPASQTQLDALLITGAYKDSAQAAEYYRTVAEDIVQETELLKKLSRLEGFVPYEGCQMEPMQKNRIGYQVFLLSGFRLSLERYMHRHTVSHLEAVNLGIDLCTALAACRNAGMLYADLKPSNVFISNKKEYKIGDLGFVPLDSLKFTPMPEKFRSNYTAPELLDDLAVLNETADTYSAGLILYQIFNNGQLPADLTKPLPAPATADEEMTGILQKACDPDLAKRWENPSQMRQALIDYMQRNTINNVPIMEPITGAAVPGDSYRTAQFPAQSEPQDTEAPAEQQELPPEMPVTQEAPEPIQEPTEEPSQEPAPQEPIQESAAGQEEPEEPAEPEEPEKPEAPEEPAFLPPEQPEAWEAPAPEAPAPEENARQEDAPADSDISGQPLWQADEAPAPEVPQPQAEGALSLDFDGLGVEEVAAAEFAAITQDDPELQPPAQEELPEPEMDLDAELQSLNQLLRASEKPVTRERKRNPNVEPVVIKKPKKRKSAVGVLFTIFLLCLLLAGGVWGYMYYSSEYLQTVNGMTVQEEEGKLVVQLDSNVRDGLLNVVCTDTYGNSSTQPVQENRAEFTRITPGTFYTLQVEITGLHKLTSPVSQVYTTQGTTSIAALNATPGAQDGSVNLTMVVEGAEPSKWQVFYSAEGEPELTKTFSGHNVTVDHLTLGKRYTFRMETLEGITHTPASGQNTVEYTPVQIIAVRDLAVVSFSDGNLVVKWDNTATTEPDYWVVCCSGEGYDETQQVTGHQATFTGISESKPYNVDVCANGMTQSSRLSISANPVTLTDFQVDDTNSQELKLSWQFHGAAPEGGWQVIYTLDSSSLPSAVKASGTSAVVAPRIPGAVYHFTVQTSDETSVFNGTQSYTCPAAKDYSGHGVTKSTLTAKLLVTPDNADWVSGAVSSDKFLQSFNVGQKISVVLQNSYGVYLDDEQMSILYVFRNAQGEVAPELIGEDSKTWRELFASSDSRSAGMDLPVAPTTPGSYVLDIYFNGTLAASANLTIS